MTQQPSLLPSNASQLELDMERVTQDVLLTDNLEFDPRRLWSSKDCPLHLLPYLAGALGLDDWDDNWPEHIKRENVDRAIEIQSTKGTIHSIKRAAGSFGVSTLVKEYKDHPDTMAPNQYIITATGSNAEIQSSMEKAIAKAVRANGYFTLVNGVSGKASLNMVGIGRWANFQRFECPASYNE